MNRRAGLRIGLVLACAAGFLAAQARAPQPTADNLPPPGLGSQNFSQVIPKPANRDLRLPPGFTATVYAEDLPGLRFMQFAPNGDLFVAQFAQNRIAVLRDTNGDGKPDMRTIFAENPNGGRRGGPQPQQPPQPPQGGAPPIGFPPGPPPQSPLTPINPAAAAIPCAPPPAPVPPAPPRAGVAPAPVEIQGPMGIAFRRGAVYIANTGSIVRYRYTPGDMEAQRAGQKIVDLPAFGFHPWRNVVFSANKMYVAVGSGSNNRAGEDCRRAAVLEFNPDGTGYRIYASGLRNPEGMAFEPTTNKLWVAVNERDYLGDDLVPDFVTGLKDGGFYGWPYSYIGQHYDPRYTGGQPELVKRAIVPDVLIPAHSTAIGIAFYTGDQFPERYRNGLFVAMHGSWNRAKATGYKVGFIRFRDGVPGRVEDFMTGFVVSEGGRNPDGSLIPITQWGRPLGVTVAPDGSLLVADDQSGRIWQIKYRGGPNPPNPAIPLR